MTQSTVTLPGIPLVESPLMFGSEEYQALSPLEQQVARSLHERGFALIDFPDPEFEGRSNRIRQRFAPMFEIDPERPETIAAATGDLRIQDAWRFDPDVKAIAANSQVLQLLSKLYGRRAFPFQTLNFPVGTQQNLHSDSVHFSSIPERFMCGVWVALEDIRPEAGPLVYLPGSHRWPILSNPLIGRAGWQSAATSAQDPFEAAWTEMVAASGLAPERFLPRKGQALIWAANLLHGGDRQADRSITRWSQVTHYYFEDCVYYTPAFSDEPLGRLDLRKVVDVGTGEVRPNLYAGEQVQPPPPNPAPRRGYRYWRRRLFGPPTSDLPPDFDREKYLLLNPDVGDAGVDPADHYLRTGRYEGRRYSLR